MGKLYSISVFNSYPDVKILTQKAYNLYRLCINPKKNYFEEKTQIFSCDTKEIIVANFKYILMKLELYYKT